MTARRTSPILQQGENERDKLRQDTGIEPQGKPEPRLSLPGAIKQLFREVKKALTFPAPVPQPEASRRKRTEETRGAFRLLAIKMVRRLIRQPSVFHPQSLPDLYSPELWQWNNLPDMNEFSENHHFTPQEHLSPHL